VTGELLDRAARERITTDTASTLFVDAGAGSGKTTALVRRILRLVTYDQLPLSAIAAVTFTERPALSSETGCGSRSRMPDAAAAIATC
jgi:ATP-dependent helicase/nuclease subunit A